MPDVIISGADPNTIQRLRRAARIHGMEQAEYLAALLDLHDRMRALADTLTSDGRWEQVGTELELLGLRGASDQRWPV